MDSLPLDPDDLRRLVSLFDEHQLSDLEIREEGVRVRLQAAQRKRPVTTEETETFEAEADEVEGLQPLAPASREPSPEEKGWVAIHAPMTGTFYRAPGPNEPVLVEVGQPVEVDQVIGLIEAMKIFSEIRSEVNGTITDIPAHNGQMVQPGQVLAWVQPF